MSIQPIRKYVAPEIPDKLYFRIGDVARLCEVPAYVLRFWETEFPQLRPNKGGTGQRLYRKRDVEMALRIKSLLYDQGYTIPGARQVFKNETKARESAAAEAALPVPLTEMAQAKPAVQMAPALRPAEPARSEDPRRRAALQALREELCALLVILEQPVNGVERIAKPAAKPQSLRPRLVLEPRPAPEPRPIPVAVETLRLVPELRPQGDLFAGE